MSLRFFLKAEFDSTSSVPLSLEKIETFVAHFVPSSDRERGRQVPLPLRRPLRLRAAHLPRHLGGGGARGALPQPEPGELLCAHAGAKGEISYFLI